MGDQGPASCKCQTPPQCFHRSRVREAARAQTLGVISGAPWWQSCVLAAPRLGVQPCGFIWSHRCVLLPPCALTHGILFLLYIKSGYLKSFHSSEVRDNEQKTRIWSSRSPDPLLRTPRSSRLRLHIESSCCLLRNWSFQPIPYDF